MGSRVWAYRKLGLVLLSGLSLAELAHAGDNIKAKGSVAVGIKYKAALERGETLYEAKADLETKKHKGFEAHLDLKADEEDPAIWVREAYISKDLGKDLKLAVGRDKKRFGREYELGSAERLTFKRTMLYDNLEVFGYAGREMSVRLYDKGSADAAAYSVRLGLPASKNYNMLLSSQLEEDAQSFNFGSWLLVEKDQLEERTQLVWATGFAAWSTLADVNYQTELIGGIDPIESEYKLLYSNGRKVYFVGTKLELNYRFALAEQAALTPFLTLSYLVHDTEKPSFNSLGTMLGVNYDVDHFRLGLNLDMIGQTSVGGGSNRSYSRSRGYFVATMFY